jgi:hypothetical protein
MCAFVVVVVVVVIVAVLVTNFVGGKSSYTVRTVLLKTEEDRGACARQKK